MTSPFTQKGDELIDLFYERKYDSRFETHSFSKPYYVQILDWRNEKENTEDHGFSKLVLLGRARFEAPFLAYIHEAWDDTNNICRLENNVWRNYDILKVTAPLNSNSQESYLSLSQCNLAFRPGFELNYIHRIIKLRQLVHLGRASKKHIKYIDSSDLSICVEFIANSEDDIFNHVLREMIDRNTWYITDDFYVKRKLI